MNENSIGENLRRIRQEHNLKQKDIAQALGIDRSTYSFYETGKTNPPVDTLCNLSKIYNVTIDCLVGLEKDRISSACGKSVASGVDPIAMLPKDEQMLLMYFRLADENEKEEVLKYILDKNKDEKKEK